MDVMLAKLSELVKVATGDRIDLHISQADLQLKTIGLDSVALLELIMATEECFKIEWDPDVSPEVFSTLRSMAQAISERLQKTGSI